MTEINLTSFGYLGLLHSRDELPPWHRLSSGTPAGFAGDADLEAELAPRLAQLLACEAATLCRSTLHAFHDLFAGLSPQRCAVFLDDGAYPIARWGLASAVAAGVTVRSFARGQPQALARALELATPEQRHPVVVVDGVSVHDWQPARLAEVAKLAAEHGGWVVVDDTHAVGLLGAGSGPDAPLGRGGGGSLAWHGLPPSGVLLVSSLSKAFAVPVAVVAGSAELVGHFQSGNQSRLHCSPPTFPELLAVRRALDVNREAGDALRATLARNIRCWCRQLYAAGLASADSVFPVRTLRLPRAIEPQELARELLARGVRLYVQSREQRAHVLAVLNAAHSEAEIEAAAAILLEVLEDLTGRRCWGADCSPAGDPVTERASGSASAR